MFPKAYGILVPISERAYVSELELTSRGVYLSKLEPTSKHVHVSVLEVLRAMVLKIASPMGSSNVWTLFRSAL
jgi:hypothetical protein